MKDGKRVSCERSRKERVVTETLSQEERHLLVERREGVLILTMNRPEARNALSPQMLVLMAEAWHEFRESKDAREGPRAFAEKRKPRFTGE